MAESNIDWRFWSGERRTFLFDDTGIWASDGTVDGTRHIAFGENVYRDYPTAIVHNETVYFVALTPDPSDESEFAARIWKWNGEFDAPTPTSDYFKRHGRGAWQQYMFAAFGNTLLFVRPGVIEKLNDQTSFEPLTSLPAGTVSVAGWEHSRFFAATDEFVVFPYRPNIGLRGLWVSDGTEFGTHQILDVDGAAVSVTGQPAITAHAGRIYFSNRAQDALWSTDGTSEGTAEFHQILNADDVEFVSTAQGLYFANRSRLVDANHQIQRLDCDRCSYNRVVAIDGELVAISERSRGIRFSTFTEEGVREFASLDFNNQFDRLTVTGNRILVQSSGRRGPAALYSVTPQVTRAVRSDQVLLPLQVEDKPLFALGEQAIFIADDDFIGAEVYASQREKDYSVDVHETSFGSYENSSLPDQLIRFGDSIAFSTGNSLLVSDGTNVGTKTILTSNATRNGIDQLHSVGDYALFTSEESLIAKPWITDGTPDGTFQLSDQQALISSALVHEDLVFVSTRSFNGDSWIIANVRAEETLEIPGGYSSKLLLLDNKIYGYGGGSLIRLNDRMDGFEDVIRRQLDASTEPVAASDGIVSASSASRNGTEPHIYNGETFHEITDLRPGVEGSEPRDFTVVGNRVYFSADDGTHGRELFVYDSSTRAITLAADIAKGPASSNPTNLQTDGDTLFFQATTPELGTELWIVRTSVAGDTNGDQVVDAADIDAIYRRIRGESHTSATDVNSDGSTNVSDVDTVLAIIGTGLGDANLDGLFNSQDLVKVFRTAEYGDGIPHNSTWEEGDWNGDGEFDSQDFVAALQSNRYSQEASGRTPLTTGLNSELAFGLGDLFGRDDEENRNRSKLAFVP